MFYFNRNNWGGIYRGEGTMSKPYMCPICYGKGTVPNNFYTDFGASTSTAPEICKSCRGSGIIFGGNKE